MFDKRYQVHRTFFTVKHFPNSVDAAMPNMQDVEVIKLYFVRCETYTYEGRFCWFRTIIILIT